MPWQKVFWEIGRPKAAHVKKFTYIWLHCFHQSILTHYHFVLSRTTLLLLEAISSVWDTLWKSAGAGQQQLLTGVMEHPWLAQELQLLGGGGRCWSAERQHLATAVIAPRGSFPVIYNMDLSTCVWSNTSLSFSPGNCFQTLSLLPRLLLQSRNDQWIWFPALEPITIIKTSESMQMMFREAKLEMVTR